MSFLNSIAPQVYSLASACGIALLAWVARALVAKFRGDARGQALAEIMDVIAKVAADAFHAATAAGGLGKPALDAAASAVLADVKAIVPGAVVAFASKNGHTAEAAEAAIKRLATIALARLAGSVTGAVPSNPSGR